MFKQCRKTSYTALEVSGAVISGVNGQVLDDTYPFLEGCGINVASVLNDELRIGGELNKVSVGKVRSVVHDLTKKCLLIEIHAIGKQSAQCATVTAP